MTPSWERLRAWRGRLLKADGMGERAGRGRGEVDVGGGVGEACLGVGDWDWDWGSRAVGESERAASAMRPFGLRMRLSMAAGLRVGLIGRGWWEVEGGDGSLWESREVKEEVREGVRE